MVHFPEQQTLQSPTKNEIPSGRQHLPQWHWPLQSASLVHVVPMRAVWQRQGLTSGELEQLPNVSPEQQAESLTAHPGQRAAFGRQVGWDGQTPPQQRTGCRIVTPSTSA